MATGRSDGRVWRALSISGVAALAALVLSVGPKPAVATTVDVNFHGWKWDFEVVPFGSSTPETVSAIGDAIVRFSHPTFDFGTELAPNPVPPGPLPAPPIDIEIVSMDLVGTSPFPNAPTGDPFHVRLSPVNESSGQIQNLNNVGGVLTGTTFFDVFIEIVIPVDPDPLVPPVVDPMIITNDSRATNSEPIHLSKVFNESNGPPEIDVFWMPAFLWFTTPPGTPVEFWDLVGGSTPWDVIGPVHVEIPGMAWDIPEPGSLALLGTGLIGLALVRRRRRSAG